MKCIILAAGYATRMYPLTQDYPKPLLKVGERSISAGSTPNETMSESESSSLPMSE